MRKVAIVTMVVELPDTERYPESYIMQRILDTSTIRNVKHFMDDLQVTISYEDHPKQMELG